MNDPTPELDERGLPYHGARWGDGIVLRARARAAGERVEVEHPLEGPPKRVLSGSGGAFLNGSRLLVEPPPSVKEGDEFALVVEF